MEVGSRGVFSRQGNKSQNWSFALIWCFRRISHKCGKSTILIQIYTSFALIVCYTLTMTLKQPNKGFFCVMTYQNQSLIITVNKSWRHFWFVWPSKSLVPADLNLMSCNCKKEKGKRRHCNCRKDNKVREDRTSLGPDNSIRSNRKDPQLWKPFFEYASNFLDALASLDS